MCPVGTCDIVCEIVIPVSDGLDNLFYYVKVKTAHIQ